MKFYEFSSNNSSGSGGYNDPRKFLKIGNRVCWYNEEHDLLMFGDITKVSGDIVTSTDGKFGTAEIHNVKVDDIFKILAMRGSKLEVVWRRPRDI